ncbi:small nuclear ribonucleo b and b protein [Rutstroemia sp. NJR-2017a WRK4]|nr:small nuclear ribonucleo b and b protein [Rutstroemia sp. NJR-2017a WRK4]
MANKQGKMINYRMRVTMDDGRQMVGQMLAFDKHMNLVLADTEEFRRVKRKGPKTSTAPGASAPAQPTVETEEKRTLGLTIVRGTHVISLSVESPPPADPSARLGTSAPGGGLATAMAAGTGIARPAAGRGGLAGPAAGVGGFPGVPPMAPFGRGAPPPGFGGGFPPPGFPGVPGGFAPPPGGPPPPGFVPPRR